MSISIDNQPSPWKDSDKQGIAGVQFLKDNLKFHAIPNPAKQGILFASQAINDFGLRINVYLNNSARNKNEWLIYAAKTNKSIPDIQTQYAREIAKLFLINNTHIPVRYIMSDIRIRKKLSHKALTLADIRKKL